jgi:hypothetical protein
VACRGYARGNTFVLAGCVVAAVLRGWCSCFLVMCLFSCALMQLQVLLLATYTDFQQAIHSFGVYTGNLACIPQAVLPLYLREGPSYLSACSMM